MKPITKILMLLISIFCGIESSLAQSQSPIHARVLGKYLKKGENLGRISAVCLDFESADPNGTCKSFNFQMTLDQSIGAPILSENIDMKKFHQQVDRIIEEYSLIFELSKKETRQLRESISDLFSNVTGIEPVIIKDSLYPNLTRWIEMLPSLLNEKILGSLSEKNGNRILFYSCALQCRNVSIYLIQKGEATPQKIASLPIQSIQDSDLFRSRLGALLKHQSASGKVFGSIGKVTEAFWDLSQMPNQGEVLLPYIMISGVFVGVIGSIIAFTAGGPFWGLGCIVVGFAYPTAYGVTVTALAVAGSGTLLAFDVPALMITGVKNKHQERQRDRFFHSTHSRNVKVKTEMLDQFLKSFEVTP